MACLYSNRSWNERNQSGFLRPQLVKEVLHEPWALPRRPWSGRRGSNPLKRRHQKQRTERMREVVYEFGMRCGEDVVCP